MVWDEDFRGESLSGGDALRGGHCIRLIDREEGEVDVLEVSHLWDVFSVSGDVDTQAVEGEDVAVAIAFRVEFLTAEGSVVSGNGVEGDAVNGKRFAIGDYLAATDALAGSAIEDEPGRFLRKGCESLGVEVIRVFVGH